MSTVAAGASAYPTDSTTAAQRRFDLKVVFGAASIGSQSPSDPGFTITRTGVGAYTLAYPQCLDAQFDVEVMSPAATVGGGVLVLTKSPTTGAATIRLYKDASSTAVDPATSDELRIVLNARYK